MLRTSALPSGAGASPLSVRCNSWLEDLRLEDIIPIKTMRAIDRPRRFVDNSLAIPCPAGLGGGGSPSPDDIALQRDNGNACLHRAGMRECREHLKSRMAARSRRAAAALSRQECTGTQ